MNPVYYYCYSVYTPIFACVYCIYWRTGSSTESSDISMHSTATALCYAVCPWIKNLSYVHYCQHFLLGICVVQIAIGLVWLKECTDLFHPARCVGQDINSIEYVDTWGIYRSTLTMLRTMNSTWVQCFKPYILCFPEVDLRIMEYLLGITSRIRYVHGLCLSTLVLSTEYEWRIHNYYFVLYEKKNWKYIAVIRCLKSICFCNAMLYISVNILRVKCV